jgi:hypothetical protein
MKSAFSRSILLITAAALWTIAFMASAQNAAPDSARPFPSDSIAAIRIKITSDSDNPPPAASDSVLIFRKMSNTAFGVGERLVFEIAYGVIKAGTSTMGIPDTVWVGGRPCYHIVTTAESNSFFSNIFKVRDRVESVMDIDGLFTWKFEKHLREGKFKSDRYETYDPFLRKAYAKSDTFDAPLYVQDILSSFYFSRTVPLEVGQSVDIDNFADGRVYPLRILVHRKERVKVPAGTFDCIAVEPVLRNEGLFKQTGKLTIWVTDDAHRMPVLMKSKIFIGSIDARLKQFSYGIRVNP